MATDDTTPEFYHDVWDGLNGPYRHTFTSADERDAYVAQLDQSGYVAPTTPVETEDGFTPTPAVPTLDKPSDNPSDDGETPAK